MKHDTVLCGRDGCRVVVLNIAKHQAWNLFAFTCQVAI